MKPGRGATRNKPDLQEKALAVIESIAESACNGPNGEGHKDGQKCVPCEIYLIAHSANKRGCNHPDWIKKTEEAFEYWSKV